MGDKIMNRTPIEKVIFEKGYRKGWIAKRVGIAPGTLSLIISGESSPSLKVALKLAKLLEISVEHLWGHLIEEENNENK
jgi:DNA-binding XRE family transcriptional regulator